MKTKLNTIFIALTLLASIHETSAQNAQFFRIAGPTTVNITALRADGTLVWSSAQPGAIYTVQVTTSLVGGGNWVDFNQIYATNLANTNLLFVFNPPASMALIPAGEFTIGNSIGDKDSLITDAQPTNVTLSAFYMDTNLVSYSQWQPIYVYATNQGYSFRKPGSGKAANHPVQTVSWYDAVLWCNARSQQAGLTPVYYNDPGLTMIYTNWNTTGLYANWTANGYRLPTEAEWEKAARGGLNGLRFPLSDTISWSQANYFGDPLALDSFGSAYDLATAVDYDPAFSGGDNGEFPYTSPVGSLAPNSYGLYDMAGNVYEWCWDWYASPPYPPGSPYLGGTDPRGPSSDGSLRVMRGGSWNRYAYDLRCAIRGSGGPSNAGSTVGFRCVMGL